MKRLCVVLAILGCLCLNPGASQPGRPVASQAKATTALPVSDLRVVAIERVDPNPKLDWYCYCLTGKITNPTKLRYSAVVHCRVTVRKTGNLVSQTRSYPLDLAPGAVMAWVARPGVPATPRSVGGYMFSFVCVNAREKPNPTK